MPNKSTIWTLQEQNMLRTLRNQQIQQNLTNWKQIAQKINFVYGNNKTSKQCRQKYINKLKLNDQKDENRQWTKEQSETLVCLYQKYGSCWSYFAKIISNKGENQIKNKFNNGLRRFATLLQEQNKKNTKYWKSSDVFQKLISVIDFINKLFKKLLQLNLTVNPQSKLYKIKMEIARHSLLDISQTQENIKSFLIILKQITVRIRSFGAFKAKYKKNWNFQDKILVKLYQFDQFCIQTNGGIFEKFNIQTRNQITENNELLAQMVVQTPANFQKTQLILQQFYFTQNNTNYNQNLTKLDEQVCQILGKSYAPSYFQFI